MRSVTLSRIAASVIAGSALTVALLATAAPTVPPTIGHQGRLYDADGRPINGSLPMRFALYTTSAPQNGDVPAWSEEQSVTFDEGYYAAALGSATPIPDGLLRSQVNTGLYLEITINGEKLSPLAKLNSVPYALVCDDVSGAIHPTSITIGSTLVVNDVGQWVGDPTGLAGPKGDQGDPGSSGVVASVTAAGAGANPTASLTFLGPPAMVSVTGMEDVIVYGHKAFGSLAAGGGTSLNLSICYQMAGGMITTAPLAGTGVTGLRVGLGTRTIQSLTARIESLPMGNYQVGLCGSSTAPASWNDNGAGMTTAMVVLP